jgi:hypothetical protein
MSRKKKLDFMQPITRVHNIFRIRTIVNAVTAYNKKKKQPNDEEIAVVLARSGLSKYRREKVKDRIMRRARDHLLTASYMGLLSRRGFPFGYFSTLAGSLLQKYGAEEECPKDTKEEAVFIDKILRLKLTNVYDMQRERQYERLKSRPCLFMLHALSGKSWLHEHQLAVVTGGRKCDPVLADSRTRSVIQAIYKYGEPSIASIEKFYSDYEVDLDDKRNMTRNIRPLLDWCQSVGLVTSKEVEEAGRWYSLTDRGKLMLTEYSKKIPIWFADLKAAASAKASLLLFYQYAAVSGYLFTGILNRKLNIGLVSKTIAELVDEIEESTKTTLLNQTGGNLELDFTLEYDVPPENEKEVLGYLKEICRLANIKTDKTQMDKILHEVELGQIEALEKMLEKEHETVREMMTGTFSKRTAISSDPLLAQVAKVMPTVGVLTQYKSDFEKETVLLLKLLKLNAIKYQGQLADRSSKTHVIRFFENNPDILVINGIESLVECKSSGEWKSPLTNDKSVSKEFLIYQQYFPEVHSDSVLISYEGTLDERSRAFVESILTELHDIVFVTKNYLVNCAYQPHFREQLIKIIKHPKNYNATDRILSV